MIKLLINQGPHANRVPKEKTNEFFMDRKDLFLSPVLELKTKNKTLPRKVTTSTGAAVNLWPHAIPANRPARNCQFIKSDFP